MEHPQPSPSLAGSTVSANPIGVVDVNLAYLGDALDHWKGSLLGEVQQHRLLHDLTVDAMATDQPQWDDSDWQVYARLLRVHRRQVLIHQEDVRNPDAYFAECRTSGDIFLDPDIGVATGKVSPRWRYLQPPEVSQLISDDNVVAVYQHGDRSLMGERVDVVVRAIRGSAPGLDCLSYQATSVAMLFLSRQPSRLDAIRRHFASLLGRHASRRVVVHG